MWLWLGHGGALLSPSRCQDLLFSLPYSCDRRIQPSFKASLTAFLQSTVRSEESLHPLHGDLSLIWSYLCWITVKHVFLSFLAGFGNLGEAIPTWLEGQFVSKDAPCLGASVTEVLRNKLIFDVSIPSVSWRVDKAAPRGLAELCCLCSVDSVVICRPQILSSVQNATWVKAFRTDWVCEEAFCRKHSLFSKLWPPGETCQIPPCWVKEISPLKGWKGFTLEREARCCCFIALFMETGKQNPKQVSTFVVFLL